MTQLTAPVAAFVLRSAGGMPARWRRIVLAQRQPRLRLRALVVVAVLGNVAVDVHAQQIPAPAAQTREFRATRVPRPPVIDGRLNDEVWTQAQVLSEFTQQDPDEGQPATERTEIRILYDDNALYFGARLFDHEPALVGRRLATRDGDGEADRITFYLDPM